MMYSTSSNVISALNKMDGEDADENLDDSPTFKSENPEDENCADGANEMMDGTVLARIVGRDFDFTLPVNQKKMTIGRQSNLAEVDVKLGMSTFVSRKHLEIFRVEDDATGSGELRTVRFLLQCKGKNGIFVNGVFQRKGAEPVELPKT